MSRLRFLWKVQCMKRTFNESGLQQVEEVAKKDRLLYNNAFFGCRRTWGS